MIMVRSKGGRLYVSLCTHQGEQSYFDYEKLLKNLVDSAEHNEQEVLRRFESFLVTKINALKEKP